MLVPGTHSRMMCKLNKMYRHPVSDAMDSPITHLVWTRHGVTSSVASTTICKGTRLRSVIAEKRAKILVPVHCQLTRHQDTLTQVHSAWVYSRAAQVGQQEKNWPAQEGRRMALISRRALLS